MAWLSLSTSGPWGEVGLAPERGPFAVRPLGRGAARGRGILPAVEELLREAGLRPADLAAVAVDVGPGSFTGVRVGVTTAKSLAFALAIPAVPVLSLAALARLAPPRREVLVLRDAGRGRVYHARYAAEVEGVRTPLAAPGRAPAAEVLSAAGGSLAVGEEVRALFERHLGPIDTGAELLEVRASAEAVLTEARARPGPPASSSPHALAPVYLQASAPERRLAGEVDEGTPGGTRNDRPE